MLIVFLSLRKITTVSGALLQEPGTETKIYIFAIISQYPPIKNGQIQKEKISKDIIGFNSTINQVDVMTIYRLFYPTANFSQAHMELPPR